MIFIAEIIIVLTEKFFKNSFLKVYVIITLICKNKIVFKCILPNALSVEKEEDDKADTSATGDKHLN